VVSVPHDVISIISNYNSANDKGFLIFKKVPIYKKPSYLLSMDQLFHTEKFRDSTLSWGPLEWLPSREATFNPKNLDLIFTEVKSFSVHYVEIKPILEGEMKENEEGIKMGIQEKTIVWMCENKEVEESRINQITTEIMLKSIGYPMYFMSDTEKAAFQEVENKLKLMIKKGIMTCCCFCSTWILQFHYARAWAELKPYRVWLHCKCDFERLETILTIYAEAVCRIPKKKKRNKR
jgi:hypothetical protein